MKPLSSPGAGRLILILGLTAVPLAPLFGAATFYFDVNGTAPGYGTVPDGTYSWEEPDWAAASGGATATATWPACCLARFYGANSYTVTLNQAESIAGLIASSSTPGATLTLTAVGPGALDLCSNAVPLAGLPVQGFYVQGGQSLRLEVPLTGSGGATFGPFGASLGAIYLYGTNTYRGGTVLSSSSVLVYYDNNGAFGTGPINIDATSAAPLLAVGGAPLTLANSWTNVSGPAGLVFANAANTPVTCTGPLSLPSSLMLRNNSDSTAPLTWSGAISGPGGLTLQGNSSGTSTIVLSGANTYSGPTLIGGASSGVSLSVASLNSITNRKPASNLGTPTTVANGALSLGSNFNTATLVYTGPGESTDRILNLAGSSGGAVLQADGTGPLVFTSPLTATGAGAKTLTLQGSNSNTNTLGPIVDSNAGATTVIKTGLGTWVLAGANTYSGNTLLQAGTLEIAGSLAGNLTNTGGALQLDSPTALSSSSLLALASTLPGGAVHLAFSGVQPIQALTLDGVAQAAGTWGGADSGALHTSALLIGPGQLLVLGAPFIVQQPLSSSVYPDASYTFSVVANSDSTLAYQWKFNGQALPGGTDSSYTVATVEAANAGSYSCWLTNRYGWTNTAEATLTVLATNGYVNQIRADHPLAYWRLDETNGPWAQDWLGGNTGTYYNVRLNQPGFAATDPDPAIGLPAVAGTRGGVQVTNGAPFNFPGSVPFTLEAWAYFTNLTGVQRLCSTMSVSPLGGWAFGINGASGLRFTSCGVQDADQALSPALVPGLWYYLVCSCDGTNYHFYVNGSEAGTGVPIAGGGTLGVNSPLNLGCNPPAFTNSTPSDPLGEQLQGRLDEVAIYDYALSLEQIRRHAFHRVAAAVLSWGEPAPLLYGRPLSGAQLNATANVPGSFIYTPGLGAVLNAGTNTLSVLFNPTDTNNYGSVTQSVTLLVVPAPLQVRADNAWRPYGQTNPVFTGSLVGLVNGDNLSASYGTPATPGSPPGTYPIAPSLLDPDGRRANYAVLLGNGTLTVVGPQITSFSGLGSPQVQLGLTNAGDKNGSVWVSTNLLDWEYLSSAGPDFQFSDPAATNSPQRFYRLGWP